MAGVKTRMPFWTHLERSTCQVEQAPFCAPRGDSWALVDPLSSLTAMVQHRVASLNQCDELGAAPLEPGTFRVGQTDSFQACISEDTAWHIMACSVEGIAVYLFVGMKHHRAYDWNQNKQQSQTGANTRRARCRNGCYSNLKDGLGMFLCPKARSLGRCSLFPPFVRAPRRFRHYLMVQVSTHFFRQGMHCSVTP